jgi:hypothetical protein
MIFSATGDKIDRKLYVKKLVVAGVTTGGTLTISDYASSMYLFNETIGTNATTLPVFELDFSSKPLLVSGINATAIPAGGTLFVYLD